MPQRTLTERKARLEAQLKTIHEKEKAALSERLLALGSGLQAAFDANPALENTVMPEIDAALKNNKHRTLLGLTKIPPRKTSSDTQ